jgi:hypothetical protein
VEEAETETSLLSSSPTLCWGVSSENEAHVHLCIWTCTRRIHVQTSYMHIRPTNVQRAVVEQLPSIQDTNGIV